MPAPDLTEMISSRICHDLVSPIGAIVNGVDLIREIGGSDVSEELGMISQSAERASALLQFYRIAFGAAEADASAIPRIALKDQTNTFLASPRIVIDWSALEGPPLSRPDARLLYRLMLCAKLLVAMRGAIHVRLGPVTALPLVIQVQGTETSPLNRDLLGCFDLAAVDQITPRLVEFPLAAIAAEELGLTLHVEEGGDVITLHCAEARVRQPA